MTLASSLLPRRPWAVLCAALALSGCGVFYSPGYDLLNPSGSNAAVPGQYQPTTVTGAPEGAVTPIDAQYILQLRAQLQYADAPRAVKALYGQPQPYRIGVHDSLGITVFGYPELSGATGGGATAAGPDPSGLAGGSGYTVTTQGTIFYPYIGTVKVAGLTEAEAQQLVQQRLGAVLKDPQVVLKVSTFRSQRVYLEGEAKAGIYIINDVPMTLPELLNRAGGLSGSADRSRVLVTRGGKTTVVDLQGLAERGIDPSQILLQDRDTVRVMGRDENRVYVLGEVASVGPLPMRNGRLSLAEALGESRGLNSGTANPRQVFVIRGLNTDVNAKDAPRAQIFHLDGRVASSLVMADAFPLQPRDVVYVDPVPLVAWNRVLSLILPSASAAITAGAVATTGGR